MGEGAKLNSVVLLTYDNGRSDTILKESMGMLSENVKVFAILLGFWSPKDILSNF